MSTKIQKWGNSLAVRIPKETAERLALSAGSKVILQENSKEILITKIEDKKTRIKDWGRFVVPTKNKIEAVSENIDAILYEKTHR